MMKMKDQLFTVKIALWRKAQPTRETHIRAHDLDHAKRISNRLFGTLGVTVEPAKPFPDSMKEKLENLTGRTAMSYPLC